MLVHIVNSCNSSFYANYLREMVKIRQNLVPLNENDDLDFLPGTEFLLVFTKDGRLIEQSRFSPTHNRQSLSTQFSDLIDEEIICTPEVWEATRFASPVAASLFGLEKSNAFMHIGSLEWALTKGIKDVIAIVPFPFLTYAQKMEWPVRQIGPSFEFSPKRFAVAVKISINKQILDKSRLHFGIMQTVTYTAPPPIDDRKITLEQIRFLDAALKVNEDFEPRHYSA